MWQQDPGRSPRTVEADARSLVDYLRFCERHDIGVAAAGRAEIAGCVRDLRERPGRRGANVVALDLTADPRVAGIVPLGGRPDSYGYWVAKWRDTRRFGPGPYVLGFQRLKWDVGFPFSVPAVATIERLELGQSVTLLAGDNGSGKSTILEAIAAAIGFAEQGGELARLGVLPAVPGNVLDDARVPLLAPVLSATKPRNGYFLRAESFFNVAAFIDSGDRFAPDLSLYGDVPLHTQSHGESFLALAANRFGADGLYLLDEPEAALSVTGALALLAVVARAATSGAQFVIATHSPILLAAPAARIYELDDDGINITDYDDLQAVRLTRGFLDAPDRYLRQIIADSEADHG